MRFLSSYFFCLLLLIAATSCKSKKVVASNTPVKQRTESKQTSIQMETVPVEKTEVTNEEPAPKISKEEVKTEIKNISDKSLVTFIDAWYGVTYKYGGTDKHGIDCSHFAARLYTDVYNKIISGPANTIEPQTITIKTSDMQEGDLIFFKIKGNKVSHVGVYIGNNKFVHASTRRGVLISDLNETYYKKYFFKAGRLK
jgi:lipoprotein Spr